MAQQQTSNEAAAAAATAKGASGHALRRWTAAPFILMIRVYQVTLGHFMGGHCRFIPSCSHYALEAYREHGAGRGSWLTLRRLLRCHPFGGSGFDPVPSRGCEHGNHAA